MIDITHADAHIRMQAYHAGTAWKLQFAGQIGKNHHGKFQPLALVHRHKLHFIAATLRRFGLGLLCLLPADVKIAHKMIQAPVGTLLVRARDPQKFLKVGKADLPFGHGQNDRGQSRLLVKCRKKRADPRGRRLLPLCIDPRSKVRKTVAKLRPLLRRIRKHRLMKRDPFLLGVGADPSHFLVGKSPQRSAHQSDKRKILQRILQNT